MANITRTTCPYCGVGCGINIEKSVLGEISLKPDPDHPANLGRLCSKGMALTETLDHPNRLLHPEINGEVVNWSIATQAVASQLQQTIDKHGADSVAFYVSGQLLTEDYYVANKLMKGFIGSANIDTNSRLCMSSAVAAHKRAFGEDLVPCSYEDLDHAEVIVLVGSNAAWCHPILYQRIIRARQQNPYLMLVVIDPRATETSRSADVHLALKPGSDAYLFNGLFTYLVKQGEIDNDFVKQHTSGLDETIKAAHLSATSLEAVADQCGLSVDAIESFFQLFASTKKVVSVFSQGINQSSSGVDKGNALINCHLLTGRIGQEGMGPFSFTGQPNAMGGREVGGLANQLAAHLDINNAEHRSWVKTFWDSPTIASQEGLKAVDLFSAIHAGKIKLVWIMATNPAVSLPDNQKVREALAQCDCVIVSDCVTSTDTMEYAHIKLPALTWGERDGTVTNTDRTLSRQRPFLSPQGKAKADWQIMTEVARKMGFAEQFPYEDSVDIFREHAALSAYNNKGERCFNIGALADLSPLAYDELEPLQWPLKLKDKLKPNDKREYVSTKRLFEDGLFYTDDGLARFIPITPQLPQSTPSTDYPFHLNTGRVRDHWHTLTRTGISPRLSAHSDQAYVEIHPDDAEQQGLKHGAIARLYNTLGEIKVRTKVSENQAKGSVFVPIHWSGQFSNAASVGSLVPAIADGLSGQPESKHAVVDIAPYTPVWHGFILSRRQLTLPRIGFWTCQRVNNAWRYELASERLNDEWEDFIRGILCTSGEQIHWTEYNDNAQSIYRAGRFHTGQLESCVFINKADVDLPDSTWLLSLFAKEDLTPEEKQGLLLGKATQALPDTGKVICACFNVGEKTIQQAVKEQSLDSVEAIGQCLQAGTNCGSCVPELQGYV